MCCLVDSSESLKQARRLKALPAPSLFATYLHSESQTYDLAAFYITHHPSLASNMLIMSTWVVIPDKHGLSPYLILSPSVYLPLEALVISARSSSLQRLYKTVNKRK